MDLRDLTSGIILQQANNCGVMGKGVAKILRDKYPKHYNEYISKNTLKLGDVISTQINEDLYVCSIIG